MHLTVLQFCQRCLPALRVLAVSLTLGFMATPCLAATVQAEHAAARAKVQSTQLKGAVKAEPQKVKRQTSKDKRKRRRNHGDSLELQSKAVLVVDQDTGETITAKNADLVMPVASLTKLMTALVVINSAQPMDEVLEVSREDIDTEKRTYSRLQVGTRLSRDEMLLLALMSSENRAASALSRHYPGGRKAFIVKMNQEAKRLGLNSTHFADAAGLSSRSVSTARDLSRLVAAAQAEPLIRRYSTQLETTVKVKGRRLNFMNSNRLVRRPSGWDIDLQKTGFTNEAGRCLVMQANVLGRRLNMVFLNSSGKLTRYGDASRVRRKLQKDMQSAPPKLSSVSGILVARAAP